MIRVFNPTDRDFSTNGEVVINATKARVHNSDNGDYYLELVCGSDYSDFIKDNNIIVVPTPTTPQAFRIQECVKKSRKIEVKAYHVFYDGSNYLIADRYAQNMNCQQALTHFNAGLDTSSPFSVYSDVETVETYRCVRKSFTECISEILDRWGGHLVRDNFSISILNNIGQDKGLTIAYKKNLQELSAKYDWSNVVTKLMPVGKDGILLDEKYVYSEVQYDIPFTHAVTFEQDIDENDYKNSDGEIDKEAYEEAVKRDLHAKALKYVNKNCYPSVNYSLKSNPALPVDIGDTIEVKDERIGVDLLTKVISYEFDAITERYINIEFGNFNEQTLSNLFNNINKDITDSFNNMAGAITAQVNTLNNSVATINKYISSFNIAGGHNIDVTKTGNVYTLDGGTRVIFGSGAPTNQGLEGDIYIDIDFDEIELSYDSANIWANESITLEEDGYQIITEGEGVNAFEYVAYKIEGLTVGKQYNVELSAQISEDARFYNSDSYGYGITIQSAPLDANYPASGGQYNANTRTLGFYRDTNKHNYSFTFTATDEVMFLNFQYADVVDGTTNTLTVDGLTFTDASGTINAVYYKHDNKWLLDETGGNVVANPAGTPTQDLNTIQIDDIIYNIAGSGGGAGETLIDVLLDTPQSTSAWASPILVSCNPLDYDLISFEVDVNGDVQSLIYLTPYSTREDTSAGSYTKGYMLYNGDVAYLSRTADAVGLWTATGTTLTLNKVVGYRFSGAIQPLIYSEEEREVGVFTDNKPLYQKSFIISNLTLNSGSWTDTSETIPDGVIVKAEIADYTTDGVSYPIYANIDANDVLYIMQNRSIDITFSNAVITVWYTKTTDNAGDGSYNTLGVPKVHYSTDEQVIGTWVDGSTLYEKSYEITNINNNIITVDSSLNANEIIEMKGTFKRHISSNDIRWYRFDGRSENSSYNEYGLYPNYDNGDLIVKINGYSTSEIEKILLTVQYTKTT